MSVSFTKMSGSGNDFIIIDNRKPVMDSKSKRDFVRKVCSPKNSVGADGVIFIEDSEQADFRWDFFNADGSSAEMCGNGGRCVARYAVEHKIAPSRLSIETTAGVITAEVKDHNVKVGLTPPRDYREDIRLELDGRTYEVDSINTGVPHAIVYSGNVDEEDVRGVGRGIRFHQFFASAGTNVDFVQIKDRHALKIRTYERGVEDETLACGTGVVAAALAAFRKNKVEPPVNVETRGGEILKVYFQPSNNGSFGNVYLEGTTKTTFTGTIVEL